ncbi:3',5'-cyclic-nucleotide phosphodiesterase 2 [Monosporozyma servazzii]
MSTLFLVDCDEKEVAKVLSGFESIKENFERVISVINLHDLFQHLYQDRIQTFPNNWNYETSVSMAILGSQTYDIRQLVSLRDRFVPTFNLRFVTLNGPVSHWEQVSKSITKEQKLCKSRIIRMNHWMNHHHDESDIKVHEDCPESDSCEYNLYTMLNHLTNAHRANNEANNTIPSIINDIEFAKILSNYDHELESLPHGLPDKEYYINLFNDWNFSALNLTTRQLIIGGFHLLSTLAEQANIEIPENDLLLLLFTLEASYHQINRFHNFKHAIDVMQATWNLCKILLPGNHELTLLICLAAIGHDIGHPGTNNSLFGDECDLSKLFKKTSVLENFHFQMFNEIIKTIWPSVLELSAGTLDGRKHHEISEDDCIIKKAILATDMSFHANYVQVLSDKTRSEITTMEIISFILKAADISNVTRPLDVSAKWAFLITLEFKDCANLQTYKEAHEHLFSCEPLPLGELEELRIIDGNGDKDDDMSFEMELNDNIMKEPFQLSALLEKYPMIPKGQLFFINTFAFQFFNKLSAQFPDLKFLIDNINANKEYWLSQTE